jgi:hypothetical protein
MEDTEDSDKTSFSCLKKGALNVGPRGLRRKFYYYMQYISYAISGNRGIRSL